MKNRVHKKFSIKRIFQQILSTLLIVSMVLTGNTVQIFAYDVDAPRDTAVAHYGITMNGNSLELSGGIENAVQVQYKDNIEFGLTGYSGAAFPQFVYYNRGDVPTEDSEGWTKWNGDMLSPGNYYIGYDFLDVSGKSFTYANGTYGIKVVKAALAVPENLTWSNGSNAVWNPVTTKTSGTGLDAGVVASYEITLYKDGTPVTTVTSAVTNYDFTSQIVSNGYGAYSFTVAAQPDASLTELYDRSEASPQSGATFAVQVSAQAGDNGIASITPATPALLIAGCAELNSMNVSAAVKPGRIFESWTASDAGVVITNETSENAVISISAGYTGSTNIAISAKTKDTNPPKIVSFAAGTGEDYGKLIGQAQDDETGIAFYAFSTSPTVDTIAIGEWQDGAKSPENQDEYQFTVSAAGQYYFYVRDLGGNITQSAVSIPATRVIYQNYYADGPKEYEEFLVGPELKGLAASERYGFQFKGWFLDEGYTSQVTQLGADQTKEHITVYGNWKKEDITFTLQPQPYVGTYDGNSHTISASVGSKYVDATYQWYKDGVAIDGAVRSEYEVKNVADSGRYYSIASVVIEGETENVQSNSVDVAIARASLTVKADDKQIYYGDTAPEYTYSFEGFLAGEDAVSANVLDGTVSCTYEPASTENSGTGTYDITVCGFKADNYVVTMIAGVLNVGKKNVEQEGANVTLTMTQSVYDYEPGGVRPEVTVKDGENIVDCKNYTVTYENNTTSGDAVAKVVFTNNYSGTLTIGYLIQKADFTANIAVRSWIYGETACEPTVDTNLSSGTITYYYYGKDADAATATTVVPSDAGEYNVYAVIASTGEYNEVRTEPVAFSIAKRQITLMAQTMSWTYDGNNHFSKNYTMSGEFAGTDSFMNVIVTGNITNVGQVENVITYNLSSSTNPDNYDIKCINGTLYITVKGLSIPSNYQWSSTKLGTANWIAVTKTGVEVWYDLELYRVSNGTELKVGNTVRSATTSYDFSAMIREDASANAAKGNPAEAGYYFKVKAVAAGGVSKDDYEDSMFSAASTSIYTAHILVKRTTGIKTANVGGNDDYVLIQGESAQTTAVLESGYTFNTIIWTTDNTAVSFANARTANTTLSLTKNMAEALEIVVYASSSDTSPTVGQFSAEAGNLNREIHFTVSASDTKGLEAWAITTSPTEPSAFSGAWQKLSGKPLTMTETMTVSESGTYYAWVKDDGGNIVSYSKSISIYQLDFAGNGNDSTTTMDSMLKIQGVTLQLPLNKFKKDGFVFQNWKGKKGSIYANGGNYTANASETLTAQWTDQQFEYEVNYYYMEADGTYHADPSLTKTFTGGYRQTIASSNSSVQSTKPGLTRDESKDESIVLTDEKQSLSIYYKRIEYSITYSFTKPGEIGTIHRETYLYGAPVTEWQKPEVVGYTFVGWVYEESGTAPETMPNKDVTVSGTFIAKSATYSIHYYTQNVSGGQYTLVTDMSETKEALHDEEVTSRIEDAKVMEGYTPEGITVSRGATGGSVPGTMEDHVTAKVSSDSADSLNINYYYTRNTYTLTLNVWKANRTDETNRMYTHEWSVLYGQTINPADYEEYNQNAWGQGQDLSTYQLASYADWSTGDKPNVMPAGNVTVSRDYVSTTMSSYQVQVYFENVNAGQFDLAASLTYYTEIGDTVTIGDGGTSVSAVRNSVYSGDNYDYDSTNPNQVLSGVVTDVNDNTQAPLVLRVYFTRKQVSTTIKYYYVNSNNEAGEDGITGGPVEIGSLTKSGRWGETYSIEPLALFYGTGTPGTWTTYKSKGIKIGDTNAENYNFIQNGYVASFNGYSKINGDKKYPSVQFLSESSLTNNAGEVALFGQTSKENYVNVYYSKSGDESSLPQHFYLDMMFTPEKLGLASVEDKATSFPLTATIDGVTYKIRVANKADIFKSTFGPITSTIYPGLSSIVGEYTYEQVDGQNVLNDGYSEITYTNPESEKTSTYYTKDDVDGEHYLYIMDDSNQFYYGKSVSYNFANDTNNAARIGYDCVTKYLADYKTAHGESVAGTEDYDKDAAGIFVYKNTFNGIMYANGKYTYTYQYGETHTLRYSLSGTNYDVKYSDGQHVDVDSVNLKSEATTGFKAKEGYDICWYTSAEYAKIAEDFNIEGDTNLYGRYEKRELDYHEYAYYEMGDPLAINGINIDYLTKDQLGEAKAELGYAMVTTTREEAKNLSNTKLVGFVENTTETFSNEYGMDKEVPVMTVYYYYKGILLLKDTLKYGTTYSEIKMDYTNTSHMPKGLHYDDANSNNMVMGYAQLAETDLCVYYARDKFNLMMYRQLSVLNMADVTAYKYEQLIHIAQMQKEGYEFAGWTWKKWDETVVNEDGTFGAWVDMPTSDVPTLEADGSGTFRMPAYAVQMEANWTPTTVKKTITHYFQETTQTYNTELMAKLRTTGYKKENVAVYQEASPATATLYYEDAEMSRLLGASITEDNYTCYYAKVHNEAGKMVLNTIDLIAATTTLTATSLEVKKVDTYVLPDSKYDMFSFGFAVCQDGREVQTLYKGDTFVYEYERSVDYYYIRTGGYTVRETLRAADGVEATATLIGAGLHQYGEDLELKAVLASGYSFAGWYNAKDVLEDYTDEDKLDDVPLRADWQEAAKLSANTICNINVTRNLDYVAVVTADEVDIPDVVISGNNHYIFGYGASSSNALTATVNFTALASSANYVSAYQWYEGSKKIDGANASTYLFPTEKNNGIYQYSCEVTISRKDNGRTRKVTSESYSVSVGPTNMYVATQDYNDAYDGQYHTMDVWIYAAPEEAEDYQLYFSDTEELTADNYMSSGTETEPEYKDVLVDESGNVISRRIYYYIHNTTGNYNDYAGSASVTIQPAVVTLSSESSYTKVYDGRSELAGSVTEEGTEKYILAHGDYFKVSGIIKKEIDAGFLVDFNAEFNDKHVDNANMVTLFDCSIINAAGEKNYNYAFADGYSMVIPGQITAYPLDIRWSTDNSYVYDGQQHAPTIEAVDASAMPDHDMTVSVEGQQTNTGDYTAYVNVDDKGTYATSDYNITNHACDFSIAKREITITPDDNTVEYDGTLKTLETFTITGANLVEGHRYEIKVATHGKDAKDYSVKGNTMRIYSGTAEVTDNYKINYGTGTLTITPKPVVVSGIAGVDKEYDRKTDADLNLDGATFDGIVAGDNLALDAAKITGAFENEAAGENKTVNLTYDQTALSGTSASNYVIDFGSSQNATTATISSTTITVTAKSVKTVYGETAPFEVAYTGFEEGDDVSCITGDVVYKITPQDDETAVAGDYAVTTAAGKYDISIDLSGLSSENYVIADGTTDAVFTVEQRPITVAARAGITKEETTKTYDGTTAGNSCITRTQYEFGMDIAAIDKPSGVVNGDLVNLNSFKAAYNSKDVETADKITVSELSIDNANYKLLSTAFDVPAQITKTALTISADAKTTVYGTAEPEFTATYTGLVNGEKATVLGGTIDFGCDYDITDINNRDAKDYEISVDGLTSDNYDITFVPGTLTVQTKEILVTAEDRESTYAITKDMPTYAFNYSGFEYEEDHNVVSGEVGLSCKKPDGTDMDLSALAGEYPIVPDVTGLTSANYRFTAVNGKFTVHKYEITVSGITVNSKTYDGTDAVATENINVSNIKYTGILAADIPGQGVNISAKYADKNVGNDKKVTLTIELNDYLKARYLLKDDTQKETNSNITQKDLTIAANQEEITYGDAKPDYTVSYDGFVAGEGADDLGDALTFENTYQQNDAVGTYDIIPGGYTSANYNIHYNKAILTVKQATLATPEDISWDSNKPGTITWTKVDGIGLTPVASYHLQLYKKSDVETAPDIAVASVSASGTASEYNFADSIRANGAGAYSVKITAVAGPTPGSIVGSTSNVLNSAVDTSGLCYAALVTAQFADDEISRAGGKGHIKIEGQNEYVVIAGERYVKITTSLVNGTGYSAEKWFYSGRYSKTTGTNTKPAEVITTNYELFSTCDTSEPITLTLKLKATEPTLVASTAIIKGTADYGYETDEAPQFEATASVDDTTDNITSDGYTYTYQWVIRQGTGSFNEVSGMMGKVGTLPAGYGAADNYKVYCNITAKRNDNQQSITERIGFCEMHIKRASYTSKIQMTGWTYGENRSTPSVDKNLEDAPVTYYYNTTDSVNEDTWNTEIPTDAGTYYVKAIIASSANFDAVTTDTKSFEIEKAKLDTPSGLVMGPAATVPYGMVNWDPVNAPMENEGVDAKSQINISYLVKLYHTDEELEEGEEPTAWTLVKEYPDITDISYDLSADVGGTGTYKFTVTAIANSSNGKDNCENSDESAKSGDLDIKAEVKSEDGVYSKMYDGKPLVLYVETSLDDNPEDIEYQWYCNGIEIPGAKDGKYNVDYVNQCGIYVCNITVGGLRFHSTNHDVQITARPITITSASEKKDYDGTALTNAGYEVTSTNKLAEGDVFNGCDVNTSITNAGEVANTISNVVIQSASGVVVYNEDGSASNYTVTKDLGKLTVEPRTIGTNEAYAEGVAVSQPAEEIYDAKSFEPEITVQNTAVSNGVDDSGVTLGKGTDYDVSYKDNIKSGTATITISGKSNYKGSITRTFKINKRAITIQSPDLVKVYDGRDLESTATEVLSLINGTTLGGAAAGNSDTITSVKYGKGQNDVGICSNTFDNVVISNTEGSNVTSCYDISTKFGIITVTEATDDLHITSDIGKTYDGKSVGKPDYTRKGTGVVTFKYYTKEDGDRDIYNELPGAPKDAGTYYVKAFQTKAGNYFAAESDFVQFVIDKYNVTITPDEKTSVYKMPMKELTYRLSNQPVNGETIPIELTTEARSDKDVGDYEITVSCDPGNNYNITVTTGKFYSITPAEMVVNAENMNATYDGTEKEYSIQVTTPGNADIYYSDAVLNSDNYATGSTDGLKFTDAGEYTVYYYVKAPNYKDVAGSKKVEIGKAKQQISTSSAAFTYDGTVHSIEANATGGSVSFENNNQIKRGTYPVKVIANETKNYVKADCVVYLTISAAPIGLQSDSAQKEYDGTPLIKMSYSIVSGGLAVGDRVDTVSINGTRTNYGESDNVIGTVVIRNTANEDVTDNYIIAKTPGKLTITKATATVTIDDMSALTSKVYNKQPVEAPAYSKTGDGNVSINYYQILSGYPHKMNTVPTDAGNYQVQIETSETDNYMAAKSTVENFTIQKAALELIAQSAESSYGSDIPELNVDVRGEIFAGDKLNIIGYTSAKKYSDVGTYMISPMYTRNDNYDVTIGTATYTIVPAVMEYVADGYTGEYDKREHSVYLNVPSGVEIYYSEEPLSESNYSVDGQRQALTYADAGNYDVYYYLHSNNYIDQSGMQVLQIEKARPVITIKQLKTMYDDKEHSAEAATDGDGEIAYTENSWKEAGEYPVTVSVAETDNYLAAERTVTYIIGKRDITITSKDAEQIYDGNKLINHAYEVSGTGLVSGHKLANVTITGEQTKVGSSKNTIKNIQIVDRENTDVTANYQTNFVPGTLEVREVEQMVEAESNQSTMTVVSGVIASLLTPEAEQAMLTDEKEQPQSALTYEGNLEIPDEAVTGQKTYRFGCGKLIISALSGGDDDVEVTISSARDIFEEALTAEDRMKILNGQNAEIKLMVVMNPDNISQEDKRLILDGYEVLKITDPELKFGSYAEVGLEKKIGNASWNNVEELKGKVQFVITSKTMEFVEGDYYILHVHNGELDVQQDIDDIKDAITISISKFSTFAFCYYGGMNKVFEPDDVSHYQSSTDAMQIDGARNAEKQRRQRQLDFMVIILAAAVVSAELLRRYKKRREN